MRILIIHAYSPANMGDGAIALAMICEAKRVFGDSVEVEVSATDPAAFEEYLGISAHSRILPWHLMGNAKARLKWMALNLITIGLLWWGTGNGRGRLERIGGSRLVPATTRGAIAAYLRADLVLACGGGYLGDAYRRQLPFWHFEYRCAGAVGKPLVFFSQSLGPTNHRITRIFMRKALDRCALFIARDDHSLDHLKTLGRGESKLALCPDVALLFGDHSREELPEREDGLCVGASLMRWQNYPVDGERGHAAYLNGMQAALQQLLGSDPGLRVRLYPTNAAFGANPMDDVAVVAEMYRRLSADGFGDRCTAVAWTANPETFMRDVAQCDLFVATRMHSAIMALNAGVAVAGVAYEEKMHGLLNLFELGDFVVDIQSPESIPDLVLRAYERRKEIRSQVWRGGPAVRKEAFRAMDLVAEVVGQRELEKTAPR